MLPRIGARVRLHVHLKLDTALTESGKVLNGEHQNKEHEEACHVFSELLSAEFHTA